MEKSNLKIVFQIIRKSLENQLWLIWIVTLKLITLFPYELFPPRNFVRQMDEGIVAFFSIL